MCDLQHVCVECERLTLSLHAFDVVFKDDPFLLSKKTIYIVGHGICEFS